ncbi:MAG: UxaA family hydrolase [Phycisphaeraceae bacterium]|nr:UxaA family hydrolase [Phycisphaeraceae bacterium]
MNSLETNKAFRIDSHDNVATLLEPAYTGQRLVVVGALPVNLTAAESIEAWHKVALTAIPANQPIIKYGIVIGVATRDITAGQWVHLHNCHSCFDERSSTLDLHSGAPQDTTYA